MRSGHGRKEGGGGGRHNGKNLSSGVGGDGGEEERGGGEGGFTGAPILHTVQDVPEKNMTRFNLRQNSSRRASASR